MLNYECFGDPNSGHWMIMVHGAGGKISTWKRQYEFLAGYMPVLVVDLRDHGLSKNMTGPKAYDLDLVIGDILNVMDDEGIKKAWFMGVSLGTILIRKLAMKHPERVAGMIHAGGIFRMGLFLKTLVKSALFLTRLIPYRMMYHIFSWIAMPRKNHRKSRRVMIDASALLTQKEYNRWLGLYREFERSLGTLFRYNPGCPELIVMGSQDHVFLKEALAYNKVHDTAELYIVPGCGHVVNIECPESFNQITFRFLRNTSAFQPVNTKIASALKPKPVL